jgi:phosphate starvation-inducible PhoH-like protein
MSKPKPTTTRNQIHLKPEDLKHVILRQSQNNYQRSIEENEITLCYGPAGSSKTFTAVYTALKLYAENRIEKIILTKPIQESGEKLGFLPGDISEKIDPFMESFINNASKMIDGRALSFLISTNVIEFRPLAYMRGATFDNSIMILDEAQNCDFRQLMLFITRMGQNGKIVITGDVSQYDIAKNKVALPEFIKLIEDVKGVGKHIFNEDDIVRAKILRDIVKRYEKWKDDKGEL